MIPKENRVAETERYKRGGLACRWNGHPHPTIGLGDSKESMHPCMAERERERERGGGGGGGCSSVCPHVEEKSYNWITLKVQLISFM